MKSQQLINCNKWVQDKEAKSCKKCQSSFKMLIRRKHHCRNCGDVFCDNCSNYFLDSKYFQNQEKHKKNRVRLCQDCYIKLLQSLRQNGQQVNEKQQYTTDSEQLQARRHSKSFNVANDKLPQSAQEQQKHLDQFITPQKQNHEFKETKQSIAETVLLEDDLMKKQKRYESDMLQKISELIERRTKHYMIYENWNEAMIIFVKQAVQDIKQFNIDFTYEQRRKSVASFTKIKKIPFVNYSATQYMKGICIRKNVAHKKMQTYMKQASILLISGSLDPDIQTFDSVVKNERKYIQIALECIETLKPNLILIEKQININLLNELEKKGVSVSIHCKIEQLRLVEQASGALIQKAFDIFNNSFNIDCIGKCDKLIYTSCDPKSIKQNTQLYNSLDNRNKQLLDDYLNLEKNRDRDWTYLFISTPQSTRSISITLSGPKIEELKNVKQCFKELCQLAYEISLEYDMIILDQRIKQDLCLQLRIPVDKSPMLTTGELQDFAFSMLNDNEDPGEIKLKKIRYHPAVLSLIHDIQQQNKEDLENYIRENVGNFNNSKISFFCQLCDMNDEYINFYEHLQHRKDVSLGKYIIDKAYTSNKCASCNTKKTNHISIRYGPGAFVKCVIGQKQQNKLQIVQNSQQKYIDPESLVEESASIKHESDDSLFFCQQPDHDLIFTYIQCKICSKQLTKSFKLERTHLEFSFYRLIQHLIKNSLRLRNEQKVKWLGFTYPEEQIEWNQGNDKCNHNQTERIYEKGETQIRLYTNLFEIYKIQHFKFNCQEVRDHIRKFDVDEIEKRREQILMYIKKLPQSELLVSRQSRQTFSALYKSVTVSSFNMKTIDSEELFNKLQSHLYEDFLELEYDSMQLYTQYQSVMVPELKRGSLLNPMKSSMDSRSTLLTESSTKFIGKQKTLMQFNESDDKFQRKNMKHSSQHLKGNIQEIPQQQYPNTQVSPLQTALSPESPGQPLSQIDEQSELIEFWENKDSINLSKQWPNIAINIDQLMQKDFLAFNYIPLYSIQDIGLIAAALNSDKLFYFNYRLDELWNKINSSIPQSEYENDVKNIFKDLQKQTTIKEVTIKFIKNQQLRKISSTNLQMEEDEGNEEETIISQSQQISAESPRKQYRTVTVQLYYPRQFECFRMLNGINVKQFIKSIASCSNWDSAGGKSGSTFFKSADDLFIFKAVKESEFFTFDESAPKYFEHMLEVVYKKKDEKKEEKKTDRKDENNENRDSNHYKTKESVLNKIYGMFAIKNSRGTTYFIAMENLFYGMSGELTVYDLKGSEAKRWNRKNLKTLLDTNYIIDRNGEPLPFGENDYNFIKAAIDQDTLFLQSIEVVDYSLLLIIDKEKNKVKVSIIDYLQYYNFNKKIENRFKLAINMGTNPTIVNPYEYRDRFVKAMDRYFMGIRSSL